MMRWAATIIAIRLRRRNPVDVGGRVIGATTTAPERNRYRGGRAVDVVYRRLSLFIPVRSSGGKTARTGFAVAGTFSARFLAAGDKSIAGGVAMTEIPP